MLKPSVMGWGAGELVGAMDRGRWEDDAVAFGDSARSSSSGISCKPEFVGWGAGEFAGAIDLGRRIDGVACGRESVWMSVLGGDLIVIPSLKVHRTVRFGFGWEEI